MAKSLGIEERNRDVIRLKTIEFYSNRQIARALGMDASTVSRIYTERSRTPNDPIMSYEEVALMEDVNTEVVKCLVVSRFLKTVEASTGFGRDIRGRLITSGIKRSDARGIGKEWISVADAAKVAEMQRPRGMYNRVLKRQVVSTRAHVGEAFHLGEQKGLKIIVRKDSVEPAQQKSRRDPRQQELPLEVKQPEFTMMVKSDMGTKAPLIIPGRALDVTICLENPEEGSVRELLSLDISMLPGDRPQIRTRVFTQ